MLTLPEIRQLSTKGLSDEVTSAQNDLMKIQFEVRNGSSKESHKVKQLKRYIARLKTLQKEVKVESPKFEKEEAVEVKVEKVKKASSPKKEKVASKKKIS